ncbi:MAG: RHS repeat-associated core domain-containing protein, partial [Armatimonadetes bacterium]|nr:RHS repeat-associated core domain-containing protein [Armatimonadota bacterium]
LNETTTFGYDNANRAVWKGLANGLVENYYYDTRSRPTWRGVLSGSTVLHKNAYVYNAASEVTASYQTGLETDYTYDAASQLTGESRTGYAATYTYDANGNRLTKTVNGVTDTYTYDSAHADKLMSVALGAGGSKTYGYDAAGRTTSVTTAGGTTNLTYDYEDRVKSITYPGGATNTFAYNGLDTRTQKVDSSGTKNYRRDGVGVTDPVLSDGVSTFTPGTSIRTGSTSTYTTSGLKNATGQTNASAALIATRTYDAFGNQTANTGTWSGPFGYAGQFGYQEDPDSGLKLLGHRYYDPSTGRFLTRDPARAGRNWYCYCNSNPIGRVDGLGLATGSIGGSLIGFPTPVNVFWIGIALGIDDIGNVGILLHGGFGFGGGVGLAGGPSIGVTEGRLKNGETRGFGKAGTFTLPEMPSGSFEIDDEVEVGHNWDENTRFSRSVSGWYAGPSCGAAVGGGGAGTGTRTFVLFNIYKVWEDLKRQFTNPGGSDPWNPQESLDRGMRRVLGAPPSTLD